MAQHMGKLSHAGTQWRVFGSWLPALTKNEPCERKVCSAKARGYPPRSRDAEIFIDDSADSRAKDESQAEGHADQAHLCGTLFRWRDVGDVRLSDGNVRAANAGENA